MENNNQKPQSESSMQVIFHRKSPTKVPVSEKAHTRSTVGNLLLKVLKTCGSLLLFIFGTFWVLGILACTILFLVAVYEILLVNPQDIHLWFLALITAPFAYAVWDEREDIIKPIRKMIDFIKRK